MGIDRDFDRLRDEEPTPSESSCLNPDQYGIICECCEQRQRMGHPSDERVFRVSVDREVDGRWIASIAGPATTCTYGASENEAVSRALNAIASTYYEPDQRTSDAKDIVAALHAKVGLGKLPPATREERAEWAMNVVKLVMATSALVDRYDAIEEPCSYHEQIEALKPALAEFLTPHPKNK